MRFYICCMNELHGYFTPEPTQPKRKGRSKELLAQRDEKLASRFFYYAHIKKLNYEDTINALVDEFDICERVVIDRLKANQTILDELFAEKPPVIKLKRKIPHFVW